MFLLVLIIMFSVNQSLSASSIDPNHKPINIYLVKSFPPGGRPATGNPADKQYFSTDGKPLSEDSIQKALKLSDSIKREKPFDRIYSSNSESTLQTATLVSKGHAYQIIIDNDWRQVELRSFEGVAAKDIQKAYEKSHPEEKWIPEPNDCLNQPWEKKYSYDFEPYDTDFRKRIIDVLTKISKSATQNNETVAVFSVNEPLRTVMLLLELADELKTTPFYSKIEQFANEHGKKITDGKKLEDLISRFQIKIDHGSWIKIRIEEGKIRLVDMGEGVDFRKEAPVPGYTK